MTHTTPPEEYGRHLSNAAMYRADAERKLDRRYHPSCAVGDLAYARWHEQQAAKIWASMAPSERPAVPAPTTQPARPE